MRPRARARSARGGATSRCSSRSGCSTSAANLALALALNEGYVSLVSVVASLYPVVTILLAVAILRERPARSQALGGAVALTGVGLIAAAA